MRIASLILLACIAGCSNSGGVLPSGNNSQVVDNELLCMEAVTTSDEAGAAILLAPVVKELAGFLVDQAADAIDREAKLYSATYSARTAEELFILRTKRDAKNVPQPARQQRLTGFRFKRYAGGAVHANCAAATAANAVPVMSFDADFDVSDTGNMKIRPKSFSYDKAKAKVAPWAQGLDVNVQVAVSTATVDKNGKKGAAEIARVDFPMGKVRLGENARHDEKRLSHLVAGWYPLPEFTRPTEPNQTFGPISVMVTVIEADDLGDVLAKGAKSLRGKKSKLVDKLLKELELEEE